VISSKIWASQAAVGKLLIVLSHVVSEKTQSALRERQGWTHLLKCCQCLATQVCMKKYVRRTNLVLINKLGIDFFLEATEFKFVHMVVC
jgi:hypothetical protein